VIFSDGPKTIFLPFEEAKSHFKLKPCPLCGLCGEKYLKAIALDEIA